MPTLNNHRILLDYEVFSYKLNHYEIASSFLLAMTCRQGFLFTKIKLHNEQKVQVSDTTMLNREQMFVNKYS